MLYCQYHVYGAGPGPEGRPPRVVAGWELRRGDAVVREGMPSVIQRTADGRLVRTLGVSLDGLDPGEYALVLKIVEGERELSRSEPFSISGEGGHPDLGRAKGR